MQITAADLKKLAPTAKAGRIAAIVATAPRVLRKYQITTPLRMQHFFANLSHESGDFNIGRENTNYNASNLGKIWDSENWRKYFPKRADLLKYAGRGEALLNIVYGNRMGNGPPSSGDGYRYRGGGLAQITGKDGYTTIGKISGLPLVEHPELVFDDQHMLECAAAFWRWKNFAPLADADNFTAVCMKWNGARKASSIIGMPDRLARLKRARAIFTDYLDVAPVALIEEPEHEDIEQVDDDVITTPPGATDEEVDAVDDFEPLPGSKGDPRVFYAQACMKGYEPAGLPGFHISPGDIDGEFGGGTSSALARFITDRKLTKLPAPNTFAEFATVFPLLLPHMRKAVAEAWVVPVTEKREKADPATVAKIAPEVVPQKRGFLAGIWATFVGILATFYNAVSGYVMQAWNWFTDNKDTGIVQWLQKTASEVPLGVWIAAVTLFVAYLSLQLWQAKQISTASVQSGERL